MFFKLIHQNHKLGNRRVEFHFLKVLGNLFNALMKQNFARFEI